MIIISFTIKNSGFSISLCRHFCKIHGQLHKELFTVYHKIGEFATLEPEASHRPGGHSTVIMHLQYPASATACCSGSSQDWVFILRVKCFSSAVSVLNQSLCSTNSTQNLFSDL